jgi:YVTN family beta-propeller protein
VEEKTISKMILSILYFSVSLVLISWSAEKVWGDSVIETIDVDDNPVMLEFNPSNNNMYVTHYNTSAIVSVIDSTSNVVVETIDVGDGPIALEFNPSNNNMYVANNNEGTVSVIDSDTNDVVETIDVSADSFGQYSIEFNPSNNNMYVVNGNSGDVYVVDSDTNDVVETIDVSNSSYAIEFNPNNNDMYVANLRSNDVSVIDSDTNEIIETIDVEELPITLEFNPSNNDMYVANLRSNSVSIIETITSGIVKPIADAGPDQSVSSNNLVHLDGTNSSDPSGSPLTYSWIQVSGPPVSLNDQTSSNPSFIAPVTTEQVDISFQLTVTNDEGTASEPNEIIITVNSANMPPPNEEPRTIGDILKGIIQNPLNVTNSIDSANEISGILTDDSRDNDQLVCDLIDLEDEYASSIREILNC